MPVRSLYDFTGADQSRIRDEFYDRTQTGAKHECWPWTGTLSVKGYGKMCLCLTKNEKSVFLASRLSYEIHSGAIMPGLFICHHCDNPPCVNPAHLFQGTAMDNVHDMMSKGRANPAGGGKLTKEQIEQIRSDYANNHKSVLELAECHDVSIGTIYLILRGVSHQDVPGPVQRRPHPDMLTSSEAASQLRLSRQRIEQLVRKGSLVPDAVTGRRHLYFSPETLASFVAMRASRAKFPVRSEVA